MLNRRELALVLAALRHWQASRDESQHSAALLDIATDGGKFEALRPEEIDRLCEQLNQSAPEATGYVLYEFDADELATTLVYRTLASAKQDAGELDNVVILSLPLPGRDDDSP